MSANEAATYCDLTFEAARHALAGGDMDEFKRHAEYHRAYAELYHHLKHGGCVH